MCTRLTALRGVCLSISLLGFYFERHIVYIIADICYWSIISRFYFNLLCLYKNGFLATRQLRLVFWRDQAVITKITSGIVLDLHHNSATVIINCNLDEVPI